jgi:thiol-disulfide isomerase/thioredoxin
MTSKNKIIIILSLLMAVTSYTLYTKYTINRYFSENQTEISKPLLQQMPEISIYDLKDTKVSTSSFNKSSKGYYVHIWGTWCGPCETEFGVLLDYAKKLESSGVNFYLIAVNDEVIKIEKFLKRFKAIPKNVIILLDKDNVAMDALGVFKVPETFLHDQNGKVLNKYPGPQEWMQDIYTIQAKQYLNI